MSTSSQSQFEPSHKLQSCSEYLKENYMPLLLMNVKNYLKDYVVPWFNSRTTAAEQHEVSQVMNMLRSFRATSADAYLQTVDSAIASVNQYVPAPAPDWEANLPLALEGKFVFPSVAVDKATIQNFVTSYVANAYNNKHFGNDKAAAQYNTDDRQFVGKLEEYAKKHGLECAGAVIMRFGFDVGSDGSIYDSATPKTCCIRVDSIGSGQHSHPIPEWERVDMPSHEGMIKNNIIEAFAGQYNDGAIDLEMLYDICRYIAQLGLAPIKFTGSDFDRGKQFHKDFKLRFNRQDLRSVYWA